MAEKARVLLIDDDPDLVETTKLQLEKRGLEVVAAGGPEEGFQRLEEHKPNVVVLDVMMPEGTEGLHWLWKVRRHPDTALRDVPVIMLTSLHATTSLRFHEGDADETGDYLPAQAFLDKPADPDALAQKIREVLRSSI